MERLFKLDHSKWKVADGIRVIKKHDLEKLIQASEIIDAAQKEAAKIKEQAKIDYQKRFEEGLLQGKEEGKAEYTLKIMETVLSSVDSLEGLERQLVDVVVQSVSKIIGEIPQDERIIRIVRKGLNAVRGEKRVVIRVSLLDEPYVRNDLKAYILSPDGRSGYIEVIGDPNLRQSDCVIETQLGVVEAGLNSQLRILSKALSSRVNEQK